MLFRSGSVLVMDNNNRLSMTEIEQSANQGIEIIKDNGSQSVGPADSKRRVATPLPPLVSAPHQSEAGSSNGDSSAIDSQDQLEIIDREIEKFDKPEDEGVEDMPNDRDGPHSVLVGSKASGPAWFLNNLFVSSDIKPMFVMGNKSGPT